MNQCINTNAVYKIIPYFPFHDIYLSLLLFVFLEEKSFVICGVWICWSEFGCVNMPEDCMFWKEDKQLSLRSRSQLQFWYLTLVILKVLFLSELQFSYIFPLETYIFFFFYCSGFCHTLKWISHGFTSVPHPDPPSHQVFSAPGPSACLMHRTWAGDLWNLYL